jgi:WD40 repeat protein
MNLGYQALLAGNFDRARDLLETHRHPQPDRRGFEWRYVWGRTRGDFEQEFTGHSNAINQVAWSADGQTLATHSMDRILKVWDLATGKERLTLTNITGLAGFSSDGARLFLGQDFNSVVVCDWQQGQVKPLLNHVGHLVAILADGQTIATTANDFALRLWDSGTGQMTAGLPGTGGFLVQDRRFQNLAVAISRDGRRAAVAKSRVRGERRNLVGASFVETISIWSVDTCRELITVS